MTNIQNEHIGTRPSIHEIKPFMTFDFSKDDFIIDTKTIHHFRPVSISSK